MSENISLISRIQKEFDRETFRLPMIESMAASLNSLLNDPEVRVRDIAELIERDPALAAKVLNLANSAAYTGLEKQRTIERAITRVGLNTIRNFLMTALLKDVFKGSNPLLRATFKTWWKHSIACAVFSKNLAEHIKKHTLGNDMYLLGLLHDIGTVMILNTLSDFVSDPEIQIEVNAALISEVIDAFHAQVGARILRKLAFDESICRIVETHREPDRYENQDDVMFNMLQVSNSLLKKIGVCIRPDPEISIVSLPYCERLEIDPIFIALSEVDIEDMVEDIERAL